MRDRAHRLIVHLRQQWMGALALFLVLTGGVAYAADTVFSTDIVDGEVMTADIGNNQIRSGDVRDDITAGGGLTSADIAADALTGDDVASSSLTGDDVANSSLTGDDVASSSLTGTDVASSSLTGGDILDESLGTTDLADGGINTPDLAISSITGSRIAASAVTTSDIANRTVDADDLNGSDRSGSISVGAISHGRCATITGSVSGAEAGDVAMLTTNGSIPSGMMIFAQRALTDAVHIKVCNLTGATSAAISGLPVRVVTIR